MARSHEHSNGILIWERSASTSLSRSGTWRWKAFPYLIFQLCKLFGKYCAIVNEIHFAKEGAVRWRLPLRDDNGASLPCLVWSHIGSLVSRVGHLSAAAQIRRDPALCDKFLPEEALRAY